MAEILVMTGLLAISIFSLKMKYENTNNPKSKYKKKDFRDLNPHVS